MNALYINRYAFGLAALEFDSTDAAIAGFAQAYSFERVNENMVGLCYSIEKTASNVVVRVSDTGEAAFPDYAPAFGYVDADLDRRIRSVASDALLSAHASSAVIGGKAVLFLGLSGCGKTTLGIEVSKRSEGTLGDEYALIDSASGAVCFEPYPFQIKSADAPGVPMTYPNGTMSRACRAGDLGLRLLGGSHELRALILPSRIPGLGGAELISVPAAKLHRCLMPSVLGGSDRKTTYRVLTRMLSKFGIGVFELRYGEAAEAADCLLKAFG